MGDRKKKNAKSRYSFPPRFGLEASWSNKSFIKTIPSYSMQEKLNQSFPPSLGDPPFEGEGQHRGLLRNTPGLRDKGPSSFIKPSLYLRIRGKKRP